MCVICGDSLRSSGLTLCNRHYMAVYRGSLGDMSECETEGCTRRTHSPQCHLCTRGNYKPEWIEKRSYPFKPWLMAEATRGAYKHVVADLTYPRGKTYIVAYCTPNLLLDPHTKHAEAPPCTRCLRALHFHGLV